MKVRALRGFSRRSARMQSYAAGSCLRVQRSHTREELLGQRYIRANILCICDGTLLYISGQGSQMDMSSMTVLTVPRRITHKYAVLLNKGDRRMSAVRVYLPCESSAVSISRFAVDPYAAGDTAMGNRVAKCFNENPDCVFFIIRLRKILVRPRSNIAPTDGIQAPSFVKAGHVLQGRAARCKGGKVGMCKTAPCLRRYGSQTNVDVFREASYSVQDKALRESRRVVS